MVSIKKGFTLIEIMVVIAIIGILAGIIFASISNAKSKGNDTHIIADIPQLRQQLENDYSLGTYDAGFGTSCSAGGTDDTCSFVSTGNYGTLVSDITNFRGTLTAVTTRNGSGHVTAYALYGQLPSYTTATYFCIDSTGKYNSAATDKTSVTCPTN